MRRIRYFRTAIIVRAVEIVGKLGENFACTAAFEGRPGRPSERLRSLRPFPLLIMRASVIIAERNRPFIVYAARDGSEIVFASTLFEECARSRIYVSGPLPSLGNERFANVNTRNFVRF